MHAKLCQLCDLPRFVRAHQAASKQASFAGFLAEDLLLRRRTAIDFDPHWLRHTAATRMLRDGIGLEVVAKLLGHANVTVTAATYGHLNVEDARKAMEQAGWFIGKAQVKL